MRRLRTIWRGSCWCATPSSPTSPGSSRSPARILVKPRSNRGQTHAHPRRPARADSAVCALQVRGLPARVACAGCLRGLSARVAAYFSAEITAADLQAQSRPVPGRHVGRPLCRPTPNDIRTGEASVFVYLLVAQCRPGKGCPTTRPGPAGWAKSDAAPLMVKILMVIPDGQTLIVEVLPSASHVDVLSS